MRPGEATLQVKMMLRNSWSFRVEWKPEQDTLVIVSGVRDTNYEAEASAADYIAKHNIPTPRRLGMKGSTR